MGMVSGFRSEKSRKETKDCGTATLGKHQKPKLERLGLGPTCIYWISKWTTALCTEL